MKKPFVFRGRIAVVSAESHSFSNKRIFSLSRFIVVVAGTLAAVGLSVAPAKGAAALWIAAPTWSYSAAAADSPIGWAYFWGLSVGAGSFSWAGAYSNDGAGDAGYAFAEAAAGRGGLGAFLVTGVADPYGEIDIGIPAINPDLSSSYPSSAPGSNPFSTSYTVSGTGINFTGSGEQLNGADGVEAFLYTGASTDSGLQSELGLSGDGGQTSSGDVDSLSALESDLSLVPLDALDTDPGSLTSLNFTENDSSVNVNDVVLVGMTYQVPEPTTYAMLGLGMAGLGMRRFFRRK